MGITTMTTVMRVALLPLALIVLSSAPAECMPRIAETVEPFYHSSVRDEKGSFAYATPYVVAPDEELIEEPDSDWQPSGQPGLEDEISQVRHKSEDEERKHDGLEGDDVLSSAGLTSASSQRKHDSDDLDLLGDESKSEDTLIQEPSWAQDGPPIQDGGSPIPQVKKHSAKKPTPKKKMRKPTKLARRKQGCAKPAPCTGRIPAINKVQRKCYECGKMAAAGHCDTYRAFMHKFCARACFVQLAETQGHRAACASLRAAKADSSELMQAPPRGGWRLIGW